MEILLLPAIALALGALGYTLHLKNEMRKLRVQLSLLNAGASTSVLKTQFQDKDLSALVTETNRLVHTLEDTIRNYNRVDIELKQTISSVAHDFRTPLTSILGYFQLLDEPGLEEDTRQRYKEIIEMRLQVLNGLIDDFYEFSLVESDDYVVARERVSLSTLLQETLAMYYDDILEVYPDPRFSIDEKAPAILSDPNALKRIFSNLLKNALTYGKDTLEITLEDTPEDIRIVFQNGLTDDAITDPRVLFQRTFRMDGNRTARNSGLGLSIVESLTKKIGATIDAEIQEGTIRFLLVFKKS